MIEYRPQATALFHIALLGFPVLAVILFSVLPARRAVIWCTLISALFLPESGYGIKGLPEYSKYSALSAVLLASIILDGGRPLRVRPSWLDIPIVLWCLGRLATSLSNGLGAYDGLSVSLDEVVTFGLPYWLGRTYFSTVDELRDLARGMVIGGLLYLPLCLYEIRFSPQLHSRVYGFMTVAFYMILRYDGFRPMVFMDSSLQVAMWMSAATVICWWLAFSGAIKRVMGVPTKWLAVALFITTLLCKARGSLALAIVGIALFHATRAWRSALPLTLLLLLVAAYPALRGLGVLDAERIKSVASIAFDEQRTASLGVRLRSEDMYIDHTAQRPLLGWGGYGRGEVIVDGERSIPDGLWVIALSRAGWIAVTSLIGLYLIPALLLIRRIPARRWTSAEFAPVAVIPVVMVLYWVDCMSNAMVTPVLVVAMGAATSWFAKKQPGPALAAPTPEPVSTPPDEKPRAAASLARSLIERRNGRRPPPSAP